MFLVSHLNSFLTYLNYEKSPTPKPFGRMAVSTIDLINPWFKNPRNVNTDGYLIFLRTNYFFKVVIMAL